MTGELTTLHARASPLCVFPCVYRSYILLGVYVAGTGVAVAFVQASPESKTTHGPLLFFCCLFLLSEI